MVGVAFDQDKKDKFNKLHETALHYTTLVPRHTPRRTTPHATRHTQRYATPRWRGAGIAAEL